ncbi:Type I restriction-modification system, DNA-methyltransferase subunit M [hydrothermal vent metagenome]|uniref:site-specific DNA-methyltransferase (adenine-specific) n=1 Tax=hydrothermal vent metagenome TaxID=652676 RepID=A0A3B1BSM6_9ZZZZ
MTKISQQDINAAAWAACNTFRGVIDGAQYKDYILVMLFVKYISDVWQHHYDEYHKQFKGNEKRIQRKLDRERFMLPEVVITDPNDKKEKELDRFRASFHSLYERRSEPNIGELINETMEAIEEANKVKLEGVFRNIDFNSEPNLGRTKDRNRRLKHLLEDFNKPQLDMRPGRVSEDVIGNTYIYLIERFATDAGKKAGEFYTPHQVSELVAKLAKPKAGDRICDPSCGSAGLLIEAARVVGGRNFALFGEEVNGSTWALARMNMFLHSADAARIEWCNTLTSPALVENDRLMKFDVVVANPPFSLDKWGADDLQQDQYNRFWRGLPPKSKGDWAFISNMIERAVEKQGRVSVVVPHGVLFRGAAEGRIRQKMIEDNLLDAVIGLPGNLFPTTSIPVAILIFDRSREKGGTKFRRKQVLFVDASRDYQPGKNMNMLTPEQIGKIVKTVKKRKPMEKYAYLASFNEIKENDFNLNIPRYVDTFEEEEPIDIDAVQQEIDQLEKELAAVRRKMKKKLGEIVR